MLCCRYVAMSPDPEKLQVWVPVVWKSRVAPNSFDAYARAGRRGACPMLAFRLPKPYNFCRPPTYFLPIFIREDNAGATGQGSNISTSESIGRVPYGLQLQNR